MDVDRLVDRIARRRFQRVLYLAAGIDVIAGGLGIEADGVVVRVALTWRAKVRAGTERAASARSRKALRQ